MNDSHAAVSAPNQIPGPPRYLRWLVPLSVALALLLALLLATGFRVLLYGGSPIAATGAETNWRAALDRETTLRRDLALLQEQWLGRRTRCPAVAAHPPEPKPESPPPAPPALAQQPAETPPLEPSPSPPEVAAKPSAPSPPTPLEPNVPLVIPKKPETLEFLRGCWHSISGLVSRRDQKPVAIEYCFDDSGVGEVTVRSDRYLCKGKIKAAMQGSKKLVINTLGSVPCDQGSAFNPWQVVCQAQAGSQATCQGVHDDKTRFDVTLLRK